MTATQSPVLYEVHDHVALITLNRPDQRNAINADLTHALHAAMGQFESDPQARVGVLTGTGSQAFCAGMDLKAFSAGDGAVIVEGPGRFAGFVSYPRTKPMIAAVNGAAVAGGCELVLACDLVIAAEHAVFGQPEVKRGLFAGAGGAFRLPRAMPRAHAMYLLLTGDTIKATEAKALGLINEVVPADQLLATAKDLARRIADNAPIAVRETLKLARAAGDHSEDELWALNSLGWRLVGKTNDAQEGPRAFAEKRPAKWTGS